MAQPARSKMLNSTDSPVEGTHTVKVWDVSVRVFHWSTAALVFVAYFTTGGARAVHFDAGYIVLGLAILRIIWGLIGSHHARFTSFVRGPREVLAYLRSLHVGQARRYLGHNPAGAAMIVLILMLLIIVPVSGWLSTTDAYFGVPWVDHLHHMSGNLLMILVGVHVCGVIVSSYLHRENLLLAMITGRKRRVLATEAQGEHQFASFARGNLR